MDLHVGLVPLRTVRIGTKLVEGALRPKSGNVMLQRAGSRVVLLDGVTAVWSMPLCGYCGFVLNKLLSQTKTKR